LRCFLKEARASSGILMLRRLLAVFDVHYETPAVLAAAATSVLPDADYPKSWLGHQLGSVSLDLNRLFGHRSFLHSLLALLLVTLVLGLPGY